MAKVTLIFLSLHLMHIKMKKFISIFLPLVLISIQSLEAQVSIKDESLTIPMIYGTFAQQFPGGDMAERYGTNSAIGPGFQVKTASNWIFGAEANFLFGNNVKNGFTILGNIMTSDGNVISGDGIPAVVALFERGFIISGKFGKLFPILGPNPNSGIVIYTTFGYMQHKIRFEVENNSAPQLRGDYKRGYDRLSGGFSISEAIGYQIMGNTRLLNFFFGLECYQAWTKGMREYLFDLQAPPEGNRFDLLIGPRITWFIPIYERAPAEYYYY